MGYCTHFMLYKDSLIMDLTRLNTYFYDLPEELIAQTPSDKRDMSRMLVLDKANGEIKHKHFCDITEFLRPGDTLVINDTKVIPARIFGVNPKRAGEIETVLLHRVKDKEGETWECLTRPGKKTGVGDTVVYGNGELVGEVINVCEGGTREIRFTYDGVFHEILDKIGTMPLPPYITKRLEDKNRYQTVYAAHEGSAAAPTAGLHFTPELLDKIRDMGVNVEKVLLHVGLGTFRPVKEDVITDHKMHTEYIKVTPETADRINECRKAGGRIISVGTTSTRTLESVTDENGVVHPFEGETGIFIYPSYKFKAVDCQITNFHLPESTLLMLICAFAGYENAMNAYNTAVKEKYRFFSFGDAMLII